MVYEVGMVVVSVQVLRVLVIYGMVDVQVDSDVELARRVSTHIKLMGVVQAAYDVVMY